MLISMNLEDTEGGNLYMGNDFYNPTGYENEGLPSGRNLEGQIALWHPVGSRRVRICLFLGGKMKTGKLF